MDLRGGYVIHRRPMIRTGHNAHTTALEAPTSQSDVDAVNAVQATPWRINRFILDVMWEAWTKGIRIVHAQNASIRGAVEGRSEQPECGRGTPRAAVHLLPTREGLPRPDLETWLRLRAANCRRRKLR